jgi:hypothetical protein
MDWFPELPGQRGPERRHRRAERRHLPPERVQNEDLLGGRGRRGETGLSGRNAHTPSIGPGDDRLPSAASTPVTASDDSAMARDRPILPFGLLRPRGLPIPSKLLVPPFIGIRLVC